MTLVVAERLEETVRGRRSIRAFLDRPVQREVLEQILDAARWAPSPHNSQPWRFVHLTQTSKMRLAGAMAMRLLEDLEAEGLPPEVVARQVHRSRARIEEAPTALLCSLVTDGLHMTGNAHHDRLEIRMAIQSVGAVLQTLFLLSAEMGIGTCWMAAPMYCPDAVRTTLDLSGADQPQALVLMGYPRRPGKVRPRLPLAKILESQ